MKQVVKPLDTRTEMKKVIDNIKFELPQHIELIQIQANFAKVQYESLIKEGFTESQAMQIISTQPSWK